MASVVSEHLTYMCTEQESIRMNADFSNSAMASGSL